MPVEKIDRVTVVSGVISKGIRIYHSELSVPAYLIIWNRDAEKLIKIIGEVANKKFIQ